MPVPRGTASRDLRCRDGNKTDRADAKALLEAARNHALTPVPIKSVEQQAVLALHRIRQGYLRTRTARINALRGHLRELGHAIPVGARRIALNARAALADETIPPFLHAVLVALREEIHHLGLHAESVRTTLTTLVEHMPDARTTRWQGRHRPRSIVRPQGRTPSDCRRSTTQVTTS